jgi:hypothetical protein
MEQDAAPDHVCIGAVLHGVLAECHAQDSDLLHLQTGHFGANNLQPHDSTILGVLTLFIAGSQGTQGNEQRAPTPGWPMPKTHSLIQRAFGPSKGLSSHPCTAGLPWFC